MALRRWLGWLAVTAALAWVPASTASAGHCSYCNEPLPASVQIGASEIGTDGVVVVVLDDHRGRLVDPTWWDVTTISVTDAMGIPVDGALELHEGFAPGAWRPAAGSWEPGVYRIGVEVDLAAYPNPDLGLGACLMVTHDAELMVVDEPRHVEGPQALSVAETYALTPTLGLDTLVCCDGALPWYHSVPGIGCPGYPNRELELGGGHCSSLSGSGTLSLDIEVLVDGAPASRDYTVRELTLDRTPASGAAWLSIGLAAPRCLELEVLDLVTGERTIHETCHGDAIADQLGTLPLDPTDELAASCSAEAYVCETTGGSPFSAWDPTACTTWPDGAPYVHPSALPPEDGAPPAAEGSEGGCRVVTPSSPTTAWLLVLAVLGLRRPRRRSC